MSSRRLIGATIVVAIVLLGLMSHHMQVALQAVHLTQGLWVILKGAAVVLAAVGLLVARVVRAVRPADSTSRPSAAGSRPRT